MHHSTRTLAIAWAIAALLPTSLAACGGTEVSARSADSTATPVSTPSSTPDSIPGESPRGAPEPTATTASPLPTASAAATRNDLLGLAATADFTSAYPDTAIVQNWLSVYPGIERTLLDDQPADASTVSTSTAFLAAPLTSDLDQAWGFAVLDQSGICAGGVVVILDGAAFPSQFVPVDALTECTAEAAVASVAALA
jgi:hypothetical protein